MGPVGPADPADPAGLTRARLCLSVSLCAPVCVCVDGYMDFFPDEPSGPSFQQCRSPSGLYQTVLALIELPALVTTFQSHDRRVISPDHVHIMFH